MLYPGLGKNFPLCQINPKKIFQVTVGEDSTEENITVRGVRSFVHGGDGSNIAWEGKVL